MFRKIFCVSLISASTIPIWASSVTGQESVTGTYEVRYSNGGGCTLEVTEQSRNDSILFELFCQRGAPSYNQGRARGSIPIITLNSVPASKVATYSIDEFGGVCNITMRFAGNAAFLVQDGDSGYCGFGGAVYADGIYARVR